MKHPFRIVPWDTDFLECLKDGIIEITQGQPGDAVVVFPHDRPRRYLVDCFRRDTNIAKPCLLPRMLTVNEFVTTFRQEHDQKIRKEAGRLDQVALLWETVQELAQPGTELCQRLTTTSEDGGLAGFFPWGVRLAELIEECFIQGLTPEDLRYAGGEVAPFGAALLGSLGRMFARYGERLEERGMTTSGRDAFSVASWIERQRKEGQIPTPAFLKNKSILLAGHTVLTGTEEIMFRHLWNEGAHIFLHTDPALAEGHQEHWACADHARWINEWHAETILAAPPAKHQPHIHYFAGYDLHSQLDALTEDLSAEEQSHLPPELHSTAIVLTQSGVLLPVLHHLPRKDCNISLGYPLDRSLLFQLLEIILKIRDQRRPDGTAYWRELANLVRHPYLKLLETEGVPLREVLQLMERRLRAGRRYAALAETARGALLDLASNDDITAINLPATEALLHQVLHDTVEVWSQADTLHDLADALTSLCETLIGYDGGLEKDQDEALYDENGERINTADSIWTRFPIDAECLFRLMQRTIPALRENGLAHIPLPWPLLKAMLLELLRGERVPFEADPLTGLQVLGMLETRLLRFSRVFLLELTDDRLPGPPVRSPLLPDSLRTILGLPDTGRREQLAAHTFHRLLSGADEVWLYWQEGVDSSGLFEGKKQRSRLVEELIWHEERSRGYRLKPGHFPLRAAAPEVHPPSLTRRSILKTPPIRDAIEAMFQSPLSASGLDGYITCPLRYYFERVCGLLPIEEVNEDDDPKAVGDLIHAVLRELYTPCIGTPIHPENAPDNATLRALFLEHLKNSDLIDSLPPESAAMLRVAGPERLRRFLEQQPPQTKIIALEEEFTATIEIAGRTRHLTGCLDRVDWRTQPNPESDEASDTKQTNAVLIEYKTGRVKESRDDTERTGAVILDYKTGRIKQFTPRDQTTLWTDDDFWAALDLKSAPDMLAHATPETDPLFLIADRIPSIQLLLYCFLYAQATGEPVLDAAFVELADRGEEKPLFGNAVTEEVRKLALEQRIPNLIAFLLLHMEHCPEFRPREGPHCHWCSLNNVCILPPSE